VPGFADLLESDGKMEYLVGLLLAVAVVASAAIIGFDRERSFYSTVLIVVATYYILFAVMGASERTLIIEILVASGFFLLAVLGFKGNLWLVAAALVGHGIFDFIRPRFIANPGVPHWWPGFCLAFDVIFGGWLALRLLQRTNFPHYSGATGRHAR
jgi:hypothetical protein